MKAFNKTTAQGRNPVTLDVFNMLLASFNVIKNPPSAASTK